MTRLVTRQARIGLKVPALALLAALAIGACSPIERNYGYVPAEDQLADIAIGQDTRDTVAEKVGAPFNRGLGGDRAWYYVSSTQRTFGPRAPQTIRRDIVAVRFTDAGAVENIERFDVDDGRVVRLTARVTDSAVSELSLIRQIFGNIGTPQADDIIPE
jgi:outer membrane protein assembly factor BamE (lipoprotein component of BamABCDE complex)